eukprot:TRINITY_DN13370_c0_g1_i2.p1 TRINITY_DN13370_c0_g1~~TRINITY_DN13370_c0_g1_i2.p1  ORF type:complete len:142 (+),score=53.69 TRINITY_DN13370_c0_g1_i2:544-969(+)
MRVMTVERAPHYEEMLTAAGGSYKYNYVALRMLLHEARKWDRKQCISVGLKETDTKWRFILHQVTTAELRGVSPRAIRADLATRYPFLGMLTEDQMTETAARKEQLIAAINHSRMSSASSDSAASTPSTPPLSPTTMLCDE